MDGKSGAEELIGNVLEDPALLQTLAAAPKPASSTDDAMSSGAEEQSWRDPDLQLPGRRVSSRGGPSDFSALLMREFKPKTDHAREAVESAVQTLAEQALAQHHADRRRRAAHDPGDRSRRSIKKLTEQINAIMHHEDFQQLESALARPALSRQQHRDRRDAEDPRHEHLEEGARHARCKQVQAAPRGTRARSSRRSTKRNTASSAASRSACWSATTTFDHSPQDVQLLGDMAQIAAAAHAPFIAAAAPSVMQMESWRELANPRDLTKIFQTPEYAAWRSLRESEDSRYLGLCMPRFLARLPYGAKTDPVEEFDFEEDTDGADSSKYCWANAAYAMATNITAPSSCMAGARASAASSRGGAVEGLPVHTFPTDDGGVDMKCPTEIAISDRREAELAKNGFMPLIHRRTRTSPRSSARSRCRSRRNTTTRRTANANLSARLPYLFASCRFAHYLKCMVRDKIGSSMTEAQLQRVAADLAESATSTARPMTSSEEWKASHPLAEGRVDVEENEENPGYYNAKFFLKPHYQLEGLTVSLRLVSRMPK